MKRQSKRVLTGFLGGVVLVLGIIAIPHPGPGWLIVFAGLGILATEFDWAKRLLVYARGKYDEWQAWVKRQSVAVKILFWLLTFTIVVITIWLLNVYGALNSWLRLNQDWLQSPLPVFN